ncbi:translation initiation factor IF-3 [bacterium]|nr:translation initiation factor IF-3 [bacterium]
MLKETNNINSQIRAPEVRVIDQNGENAGILPTHEALKRAKEAGLDLIEISPNAVPPVAKIMDYGKFQYELSKKQKEARTKQHITETKTIQVKIGTGDHDLELKAKNATNWLKEGHRVKVDLYLRGRAKYLDKKFLDERIARVLDKIGVPYTVAEGPMKSPKGLTLIIEKTK